MLHLIPHIEGTFPLSCNCDGSRLTLHQIFFNCCYTEQREPILNQLYEDKENFVLKSILADNDKYSKLVINFLKETNLYDKI